MVEVVTDLIGTTDLIDATEVIDLVDPTGTPDFCLVSATTDLVWLVQLQI